MSRMTKAARWSRRQVLASLGAGAALSPFLPLLNVSGQEASIPRRLVLFFTPAALHWQALAFLIFRLFDILKPPPIRHYDRTLKNGFGVMFDDLIAAFYTLLVLAVAKMLIE